MNNTTHSVSLVITSCDRFDLLEQTLESFFNFNTYKLNQIIIIEDSGKRKQLENVVKKFPSYEFELIINEEKLGQLKSIDKAYSQVKSKYIFHCEDDWEFTEKSFIEKSVDIMEENPNILSVWLRDIEELKELSFSQEEYEANNQKYRYVYDDILSFNPSLRRLKEYKEIENYSKFFSKTFETEISNFYKEKDFVSAILLLAHVKHLGWHRRVANIHKNKSKFGYTLDNYIKKIKAKVYKKLKIGRFK